MTTDWTRNHVRAAVDRLLAAHRCVRTGHQGRDIAG